MAAKKSSSARSRPNSDLKTSFINLGALIKSSRLKGNPLSGELHALIVRQGNSQKRMYELLLIEMVADAVWCVRAKTSSAHLKRNHQSNDLNGNSSRRVTMANVQIKKRAEKLWARTTCEKIKGANTFDEIAKAPKERWLNSSLVNSANKQIFNRGLFGTERKWNCHMNVFESMFHRRCQNKSVKTLFFQSSSPYCMQSLDIFRFSTLFWHRSFLYAFLILSIRFCEIVWRNGKRCDTKRRRTHVWVQPLSHYLHVQRSHHID